MSEISLTRPRWFDVDDYVVLSPFTNGHERGDIFRVVTTPGGRRSTYLVENTRTGSRLKGAAACFEPYEGPTDAIPTGPKTEPMLPGTVVMVKPERVSAKLEAGPHVVLSDNAQKESVKMCRLGGDSRYWPSIPRTWLDVVDVSEFVDLLGASKPAQG